MLSPLLQDLPKLAAAAVCASIVAYNLVLQFVVPVSYTHLTLPTTD